MNLLRQIVQYLSFNSQNPEPCYNALGNEREVDVSQNLSSVESEKAAAKNRGCIPRCLALEDRSSSEDSSTSDDVTTSGIDSAVEEELPDTQLVSCRELEQRIESNRRQYDCMCCVQSLVQELGIRAVRPYVMSNLIRDTLRSSLDSKKEAIINRLRCKEQKEILYPLDNADIDLDAIELSLWVFLAEHVTTKVTRILPCSKERGHIDESCVCNWKIHAKALRTIRNQLVHHRPLGRNDWKVKVQEAERALRGLGISSATISSSKRRKFDHIKELVILPTRHLYDIPTDKGNFMFLPRIGWRARPALEENLLKTPVPYVIISHTVTHGNPLKLEQCADHVLMIQHSHMEVNGWSDIGFNFLIGNDGVVYEGRGWNYAGAFAYGWNFKSYGIALIGTYCKTIPSESALRTLKLLLHYLRVVDKLDPDYTLYALRQVRPFPYAPGDPTYEIMKTWPHWKENHDGITDDFPT